MSIEAVLLSHQMAAQRGIDVLGGNLALSLKPGGQSMGVQFQEVMHKVGKQRTRYVQDGGLFRNTAGGQITASTNPLNFALIGNGYFKIQKGEQILFQRGGNFRLNSQRQITNGEGLPVLSEDNAPIIIPQNMDINDLTVSGDFTMSIKGEALGKLGVARFDDKKKVIMGTQGYFESDAEPLGIMDENGVQVVELQQFATESPNMTMPVFMVKMMTYHRNFEANQRALEREHKRQMSLINDLMKPAA
jgi:flagellar basal-body rod protein FlgF